MTKTSKLISKFVVFQSLAKTQLFAALSFLVVILISSAQSGFAEPTSQKFHGISYGSGSYTNPQEIPPSFTNLQRDITQLEKIAENLRIFGLAETQEKITQLAAQRDIPVLLSVYLGDDANKVDDNINDIIRIANENHNVKGIIFDGMQVDRDIKKISTLVGLVNLSVRDDVFVTISASYDTWTGNPSLASTVDVIFLKSHQYWQGYSVDDAIDVAFEQRQKLEKTINENPVHTVPVILEEHGWPSAGHIIQCAEPSEKAQRYFIEQFVNRANYEKIPYFLFSAYDEPWKPTIEPDISQIMEKSCLKEDVIDTGNNAEHNWGLFQTSRVIKPELYDVIFPIIGQYVKIPEPLVLKENDHLTILSPTIQSRYNDGDTLQTNINNLNGYESISIYNEGKLVKTFDGMTENTKLLLRSYDGIGFDDVTIQLTKQPNNNPLMFLLPNAFAQNDTIPVEFAIIPYGFATCGNDESCYHVNVDDKQLEFPVWILAFLGIGIIPFLLKRSKKKYGTPLIEKPPTSMAV